MHVHNVVIHNVRPELTQIIDNRRDRLLVADNRVSGNYNGISFFNLDLFVILQRHSRERGHRLPLTSGCKYQNSIIRHFQNLLKRLHNPFRNFQISEFARDSYVDLHASSAYRDNASVPLSRI
ncbi:MAG: hypothetical protein ACD_65C00088G0001 [uncultured bacterium]|nr:MAG: hypothetical protein ACD_65C00088G0001 [uncultured bacterium]